MQNSNIWHKLHLHRQKVMLAALMLLTFAGFTAKAQNANRTINLPTYDEKRLHYGFQIGVHASSYQAKYSDEFSNPMNGEMANLQAVMTPARPGFSLGFILNLRLADQVDLRLLPKVGFYEYALDYVYNNGQSSQENPQLDPEVISQTNVEIPLMIKYKSMRRGNTRMYMTGGASFNIRASHNKDALEDPAHMLMNKNGVTLELGIGMDQYFPLFKFSPELRYSMGLTNSLGSKDTFFHDALDKVNTHNVSLYLNFE